MADKKKPSSQQTVIIAIVAGVIALLALLFFGRLLILDILLNQKVLSKKSTALSQVKKNEIAAPQLVSQYEALGGTAGFISRSLPTKDDYPAVAAVAEKMGDLSSARVKSVSPIAGVASGTTGDTLSSARYSISLDTSYAGLIQYLQNLQLSSWPMQVKSVTISGNSSQIKADLIVNVFYKGPGNVDLGTEAVK